ncbi:MAG: Ig-like domain-containing protein, partial [Eubacteriales bacterium]|nr:Ig-like domain-containing protein [Eubacteriales bacterium]
TPSIPSHIHTWGSGEVTKLATCTESGWITYTCTSCGMKSVEAISATNHVGEKEIRDAKPATCKAEGYTGDTYCKDCGTLLENGTLLEKIKEHTWSKWNTTSSATVFAPKMQKRTCLICDISDVRLIGEKLTSKITLSAKSLKLKVGQSTKALKVSKMANGDYVTSVESSDTKILKVTKFTKSGSITLKAQKKSGKVKLNINLAGGAKKSIYVTVQKDTVRTAKISGLPKKLILEKGEKKVLKPLIAPITSQEKITYAASNQKVATISSKGVITAKKKGTTKITVKSGKKMHIIEVTVL